MCGSLLSTSEETWTGPPEALLATAERLKQASGLLVPHDGGPVADVQGRPERWALLGLLTGAARRGVPVLAWGSGAALAGRALGAKVHAGAPDWSELPRGATVQRWHGEMPLHWTAGRVTAWAAPQLPDDLHKAFLASLPELTSRTPATLFEELGGEAALRPLLADFYAAARADDLLGPVFGRHVQDWESHLERVSAFWATMLGGSGTGVVWRGNLNTVHTGLEVRAAHLERWLELFAAAAHRHLCEEHAALLLRRGEVMAKRLGKARGAGSGTFT
ncbi:group III truncated hemoglobin [Deinococcus sp.]|uniref:group III truncated hemoglobin n=1 Tax=Deinococcus sp. TaxID=47478 RepID=UPI0025BD7710|nr:group III truncated hemoglobin [Deinococcus sp.]